MAITGPTPARAGSGPGRPSLHDLSPDDPPPDDLSPDEPPPDDLSIDARMRALADLARVAGYAGRVVTLGIPVVANRRVLVRLGWTADRVDPQDPPWCPPGGASWVVHGDPAAMIGGFLSLWIQSLHPLALAGVMDHSTFEEDPLGRLQRTGSFVTATTFCPGSRSAELCARVRTAHGYVTGTAPDGRPYRAGDPRLLDWVHCALLLAIGRCWLLYGTGADPGLLDDYVAEQARVPRELGDPDPPTSWAGLLARVDEHRADLVADDRSRHLRDWLARPPVHGPMVAARPLYRMVHAAAVAAAPPWARQLHEVDTPRWPGLAMGRVYTAASVGLAGHHSAWPR